MKIINEVKELTELLSIERLSRHKKWIEVGQCLYNIQKKWIGGHSSSTYTLLDTWIDISRKSPTYKDSACEKIWLSMKLYDNNFGMASLNHWAKTDNPDHYKKWIKHNILTDIIRSHSKNVRD